MSLILDALRKSEGQRQRHAGPGLATVPERNERRGPPAWTIALAVLLGLNALLVAVLVLRGPSDPAPARPAEQALQQKAAPPATRTPEVRTAERVALPPPNRAERQEVRPLAAELPPPAPPAGTPRPAASTTPEPAPSRAPATTSTAPSRTPGAATQATADARLPRMSELVVQGALNVPDMHVDIHVYSGDPAERFVFINMRKYVEGDATREGPTIERISETGVVMSYQGRRFMLPRD